MFVGSKDQHWRKWPHWSFLNLLFRWWRGNLPNVPLTHGRFSNSGVILQVRGWWCVSSQQAPPLKGHWQELTPSPLVHRIQRHVDHTATASAPSAFPSLNFFGMIFDFGNSPRWHHSRNYRSTIMWQSKVTTSPSRVETTNEDQMGEKVPLWFLPQAFTRSSCSGNAPLEISSGPRLAGSAGILRS